MLSHETYILVVTIAAAVEDAMDYKTHHVRSKVFLADFLIEVKLEKKSSFRLLDLTLTNTKRSFEGFGEGKSYL